VHNNIKAGKAAIIKRRIYPPHLPFKRDLIVLPISLFESFPPAGPAGKYGGVEDTNSR
jgi:hypothetical protein